MKKLLFLITAAAGIVNAQAQISRNTTAIVNGGYVSSSNGQIKAGAAVSHTHARTTTVTIATEHFATGTDTTLPAGWTAGILNGTGTWHWANTASTSSGSMGVINSTTAADGWMIFDADSLNNDCGCAPSGWLQSPGYNCSGHPTVRLNFEEFFGMIQDTCDIWVSTDPSFATYTSYPVTLNNSLSFFDTTVNATLIHMDISAAAAGHPAVYIRFVFRGDDFFDRSWLLDDMTLTELEPHDVGIDKPFLLVPGGTAYNGTIASTPLSCVDSIYPGAMLTNYGANTEAPVLTLATILRGISPVYTQDYTSPSIPVGGLDSVMKFPGFKPTLTGNYTCQLFTNVAGDADLTNNGDSIRFAVTDTTWMQNDETVVGTNLFVRITPGAFPGAPNSASMIGIRFDLPSGAAGDTVSGFGVAISPLSQPTTPGAKVSVQLYARQKADTGWVYKGTSVARPVTAADTSSFTTIKWMDFRIDTAASGGVAPFVLQPGTSYIAMLQLDHVTTPLLVFANNGRPVYGIDGGLYYGDTSLNDGGHTFRSFDTGENFVLPFIRMYFGPAPQDKSAVHDLASAGNAGTAYPDPASARFILPVNASADGKAVVTLRNATGQVVSRGEVATTGGATTKAVVETANLPAGLYTWTVDINGVRSAGKITVRH